jgi:hypothetical protein
VVGHPCPFPSRGLLLQFDWVDPVGWVGWVGRCRWLPDFDGKACEVSALNYVVHVVAHEHDELAAIPTCCRRVIGGAEHSQQGRCRLAAGDDVNQAAAGGLDLAECLFADPIGDIAVLGPPDDQEFSEKHDGYWR